MLLAVPVVEHSSRANASARNAAAGNNDCSTKTVQNSSARQRRSSRAMASLLVALSFTPEVSGIDAGEALT